MLQEHLALDLVAAELVTVMSLGLQTTSVTHKVDNAHVFKMLEVAHVMSAVLASGASLSVANASVTETLRLVML